MKRLREVIVEAEATKPNFDHGAHELMMKHQYTHFSHGKHHDGYIQKFGDMQMPISKLKKHLEKHGYKPSNSFAFGKPSEFKDSTGRMNYTYDSPHKPGAEHKQGLVRLRRRQARSALHLEHPSQLGLTT